MWNDWYGEGNVHDFLLGKPPNFKGQPVAKAEFLMEKQFLATWLNVKAYWDWTSEISLTFPGTADVGMDPNATVYLTGDAEVALFGSTTPTVMDILDKIEDEKGEWYTEGLSGNFKTAQVVLDKLNNAENNGYGKFIYPEFDPGVCPIELRENPPYKNTPLPGENVVGSVVMVGDSTNDELVVFVYLEDGDADTIYQYVVLEYYDSSSVWQAYQVIGSLTTDSHGHGTFYTRESLTPGTYYLQIFVGLTGSWGATAFGTDIATITIS